MSNRVRDTVLLFRREYRRQVSRLNEWTNLLTSERGLWPHQESVLWRLDETEGPHRIRFAVSRQLQLEPLLIESYRKKLEPQNDTSPSSRVDALEEAIRDVRLPEAETGSIIQVEVPPWADSYEISATEMEGVHLTAHSQADR